MNQDLMVAAIGDQLDALSSLISATIGLALLAGWAGLQGSDRVSILSLSVKREHAFYLLGACFIIVNVSGIIYFLRLADMIALIDGGHIGQALTVLGTNAWPYNPFAYFGPSRSSMLHSGFGYGLLIVVWWIGYTALSLLIDDRTRKPSELLVMYGFLAVGLLSMGAIQHVFQVIVRRLGEPGQAFPLDVGANLAVRGAFTIAGIAVGGMIFLLARSYRARRLRLAPQPAAAAGPGD